MSGITVLIPHWRTLKMTAFTVAQYIKYKEGNDVEIIVIDNSYPDESIKGLEPFKDQITIINNTSDKLSSHGIAYDMAMPYVKSDWVLTSESDSYPTGPYIEYYKKIMDGDYDLAASYLKLSGGNYGHPAGGLLKKSLWKEMKQYCESLPYSYFPNMAMRDNFPMHLMVHDKILDQFLENPDDWIELSESYKPYSRKLALEKMKHYSPTCGPFHDGRGGRQESIHTFGQRNAESEVPYAIFDEKWQKIIGRIGEEPGQAMYYWALAKGKKVFHIPTEVHWLPGKENQQQEYTINEAGIKHIWAGSSYLSMKGTNQHDVYEFKRNQIEEHYNSLPEHQKIKL